MTRKIIPILTALLLAAALFPLSARAQKDGEDVVIGTYRVLPSRIFGEDRLLVVHLPRGYEDDKIGYPVLYHLYGDNITDYIAPAMVACDKLGQTGEAPPLIIVGVANTDRYRDNLPFYADGSAAGADTFLRFFKEELIPFIDKNYRTKSFRILAGPQAGSVFALYSLVTDPGVFDLYITTNPFERDERITRRLLSLADDRLSQKAPLKKFFYMAYEDSDAASALEQAEKLKAAVEAHRPEGLRFHSVIKRASGFFITPVPVLEALRTFFADFRLPQDFQAEDLSEIKAHYERLSGEYGFAVDPPELMLTFTSDSLQQRGKVPEAIELLEYQLTRYPKSLNAFWRLGEIHRTLGRYEKALGYYRTFLAIRDTDAAMIVARVEALERYLKESAVYLIEKEIEKAGIEAGLSLFRKLKSDPENTLTFTEADFNSLGYKILNEGRAADAVHIFRINTTLYPRSSNVFDSLGEAYMRAGDIKRAIENYRKALDLNPDNANAKAMLEKLEKKTGHDPGKESP